MAAQKKKKIENGLLVKINNSKAIFDEYKAPANKNVQKVIDLVNDCLDKKYILAKDEYGNIINKSDSASKYSSLYLLEHDLTTASKITKHQLKQHLPTDFLDRADEVYALTKEINDRIVKSRARVVANKEPEKDDFKILVCGGATGIGKTKLLIEIEELYMKSEYFSDILPVLISFNSNSPYTSIEDQFDIEKVVLSRAAVKLGHYNGQDAHRKAYQSNQLDFGQVFKNPPECILLLIDEFNNLPSERLTEFVTYCGRLILPKRKPPFVVIVTAGTLPGKLQEIFTISKCPPKWMPISALKVETMVKDLKANNLQVRKEMYKVLQDICGIPRLYIELKRQTVLPETYLEGLDIILSQANIPKNVPINILDVVVPYSLLEYPVGPIDVKWDEYISRGRAFLYPTAAKKSENIVKFPMYWINTTEDFYKKLDKEWRPFIYQLYLKMTFDATNGIEFEKLACMWISLRTFLYHKISSELIQVPLSKYIGIDIPRDNDYFIRVESTSLFQAKELITDQGFPSLTLFQTETPAVISKGKPFVINCVSNQDGFDCVQLLFDTKNSPILVFYQFKLYSTIPADAKKKLEDSLKNSVPFIKYIRDWYSTNYESVASCMFLAVVNYCNQPNIPTNFQTLINSGLEYYFVQGNQCRKFMTSIICERNNIWTRSDKLLINIAPLEAIKMLPHIGDKIAKRIFDIREELGQIDSLDILVNHYNSDGLKLGKQPKDTLRDYIIW